jgi:hypothetical protein
MSRISRGIRLMPLMLLAAMVDGAQAAPLAIVTPQGDELLRCRLPTQYLPDVPALVCDVAPFFGDGFE